MTHAHVYELTLEPVPMKEYTNVRHLAIMGGIFEQNRILSYFTSLVNHDRVTCLSYNLR